MAVYILSCTCVRDDGFQILRDHVIPSTSFRNPTHDLRTINTVLKTP
jgi:hypothetical protein